MGLIILRRRAQSARIGGQHEANRMLAGVLAIRPADAGMHLLGMLVPEHTDVAIAQKAARLDLITPALSEFCIATSHHNALLLGFTVGLQEISAGIQKLASVF